MTRRGARARFALVVLGVVLLSSCRLQLAANVAVTDDGSGQVEVVAGLDPDAVERIGGDLSAVLSVEDLEQAGWTVSGPTLEDDGYTRIRVSRPFANPDEAAAIFREIAGDAGPFQDFRVTRSSSFASTEWGFTGRVDFAGGLAAFSDERLAAELDGEPLGQTVDEIEAQLGEPLSQVIQVQVEVRLPGAVTSNATTKTGHGARWQVAFGDRVADLEASATEQRTSTLVAAGAGATCAGLLLLYGVVRLAMRSRTKRRSEPVASDGSP